MKNVPWLLLAVLASLPFSRAEEGAAPKTEAGAPQSEKEKASYALGLSMGSSIKEIADELDQPQLFNGVRDSFNGGKHPMSDAEIRNALQGLEKKARAKHEALAAEQTAKNKVLGEKNLKDGAAFLLENKAKKGVVTTASGLQYSVVQEGAGETPKEGDTVDARYRGTLLDGSEFDSALDKPAVFPVGRVIAGWQEALKLMKVGSKWKLFIPPDLAYGETGYQDKIAPNSTLIFDIELVGIEKK